MSLKSTKNTYIITMGWYEYWDAKSRHESVVKNSFGNFSIDQLQRAANAAIKPDPIYIDDEKVMDITTSLRVEKGTGLIISTQMGPAGLRWARYYPLVFTVICLLLSLWWGAPWLKEGYNLVAFIVFDILVLTSVFTLTKYDSYRRVLGQNTEVRAFLQKLHSDIKT